MDVGHGILGHGDLEVSDVGVERRIQHTLLGDLAAQHHVVDVLLREQVRQWCLVEDGVPGLEHEEGCVVGPKWFDEVGVGAGERLVEQLSVVGRDGPRPGGRRC